MASFQIQYPRRSTIGLHKAARSYFFALGKCWGGVTRVRGQLRHLESGAVGPDATGTVKDSGRWFILFRIEEPADYAEYSLTVKGFVGEEQAGEKVVPRFAVVPRPLHLAPYIEYPPDDNPYVIEGLERSFFVTEGSSDEAIARPTIEDVPADDWDSVNLGNGAWYWYGVFQDLDALADGELRAINTSGPSERAVMII